MGELFGLKLAGRGTVARGRRGVCATRTSGPLAMIVGGLSGLLTAVALAPSAAAAPQFSSQGTPGSAAASGRLADANDRGAPGWTAVLGGARPREATLLALLAKAPRQELVVVRDVGGRPQVDVKKVGGQGAAVAAVREVLADPTVVSVSTPVIVKVQEGGFGDGPGGAVPRVRPTSSTLDQGPVGLSPASPNPRGLNDAQDADPTDAPNDPLIPEQWGLTRLGGGVGNPNTGQGVIVAVVDTGVQGDHPDLAGALVPGYDFITGSSAPIDPFGHGTHVAGIIAARQDNGIGGAGLAPQSRVMPVRVLDDSGSGTDATVAQGVIWAVDHGADVINLSVGAPDYSAAEAAAIAYAMSHDVVVVAAAGNYKNVGNPRIYPAAFPGVLGVGAIDDVDDLGVFSSTGPDVDLAAPGVEIVSTYPPSGYSSIDGTSMAAPFVAASAALVRAAVPALSGAKIATLLEETALDLPPTGRDQGTGSGLVEPFVAIAEALEATTSTSGVAPQATALQQLAVPTQISYGSSTTLQYRLFSSGSSVSGQRVWVCYTMAPSTRAKCSGTPSDAKGMIKVPVKIAGTLQVWAQFDGNQKFGPTMTAPVTVRVLPVLKLTSAKRTLVLQMTPIVPGGTVLLQRQTASGWSDVSTLAVPTSGKVTAGSLTSGTTYRFVAPATDRTSAAVSSALKVP